MKMRVTYVGICGSDIQRLAMGQDVHALGHEIVATDTATKVSYAVNPLVSCGKCGQCLANNTRFCKELTSIGKNGVGGFAGGVIEVSPNNAVRLPNADPVYTLTDPLACVMHGLGVIEASTNKQVLVVGDGIMALLFAEVLSSRNFHVVQAIKNQGRAQRAHAAASVTLFDALEPDAYHTAIICVGGTNAQVLNRTIQTTRPGGQLLVAGAYHSLDDSIDIKSLLKKEIRFSGTFSFEPDDFRLAANYVAEHLNTMRSFVSNIFDDTAIKEAISHHKTSDLRRKVVVAFD